MRYLIIVLSLFLITCGGDGGGGSKITEPEFPSTFYGYLMYGTSADEVAHEVIQVGLNSYVLAGWTSYYGNYDIYIVQFDYDQNDGQIYYSESVLTNYSGNEIAYDIVRTMDGNYVIAGSCTGCGNSGSNGWGKYFVKVDNFGAKINELTITNGVGASNGDPVGAAYSIFQKTDGQFVTAGWGGSTSGYYNSTPSNPGGPGYTWSWFGSLDNDLSHRQTGIYDKEEVGNTGFYDIVESGNYYVAAGYRDINGDGTYQLTLNKFLAGDPFYDDSFSWKVTLGDYTIAKALDITISSGFIVVGNVVLNTDNNGNILWLNNLSDYSFPATPPGDPYAILGNSIQGTSDSGYIIAGRVAHSNYNYDAFLLKIDSAGNEQWLKLFGGEQDDSFTSVIQDYGNGGYVAVGYTQDVSNNGGADMFFQKVNADGIETYSSIRINPKRDNGMISTF